jgi:hypothetical protein
MFGTKALDVVFAYNASPLAETPSPDATAFFGALVLASVFDHKAIFVSPKKFVLFWYLC